MRVSLLRLNDSCSFNLENVSSARLNQRASASALAQKAGISRTTLHAVECGEPTPTMGTSLRVMSALGLAGDFALLASDAARFEPKRKSQLSGEHVNWADGELTNNVVVKVAADRHVAQDLQSMLLHKEAVRLIRQDP